MLKRTKGLLPLLVLALGTSAVAQDKTQEQKPATKPEVKQEKPVAQEASAPAAATLTIPLTGVTKDNTSKINEALKKISHSGYHCPKCNATSAHEGMCKMCNVALEKDTAPKPVAKSVVIDDKGALKLALDTGQRVKLSEIEQAAKANGASVNRAEYIVPAYSRIVVSGPADPEAAKRLETALADAKVFTAVTVGVDEGSKTIYVMPTSGSVKLASAISGIEKAGTDFKFQDLEISAACVECAKKGMPQAACKACWGPART
jgi:hypothetical protein